MIGVVLGEFSHVPLSDRAAVRPVRWGLQRIPVQDSGPHTNSARSILNKGDDVDVR